VLASYPKELSVTTKNTVSASRLRVMRFAQFILWPLRCATRGTTYRS
jgi:hypothetical protein